MSRVLVVDDEKNIRSVVEAVLQSAGFEVFSAENAKSALILLKKITPDIIITDLVMEEMNGLDLLDKVREYCPSATVIMMTGYGSVDTALLAMKRGAYDFIVKPFTPEQLEKLMGQVRDHRILKLEESQKTFPTPLLSGESSQIVTRNARMQKILEMAKKVARTDSTILITGESGTGKTLVAKYIHENSLRARGPFAVVNCATLSENLLESELFGHVRGSFTGAVRDKLGRLQAADSGTVFLDEIGEISPNLQTKLLRFLQDREFERVGDTKTIQVDVRIIAATNKDLDQEVRDGDFREDLFFRLSVIDLYMPALRHRPEDILPLAEYLLAKSFSSLGRTPLILSEEAKAAIQGYSWPGNIRELKNALERASILSSQERIQVEDLPDRVIENSAPTLSSSPAFLSLQRSDISLEELERQHIQHVLASTSTLEEASRVLGIDLSTLWRKRRRYGFE